MCWPMHNAACTNSAHCKQVDLCQQLPGCSFQQQALVDVWIVNQRSCQRSCEKLEVYLSGGGLFFLWWLVQLSFCSGCGGWGEGDSGVGFGNFLCLLDFFLGINIELLLSNWLLFHGHIRVPSQLLFSFLIYFSLTDTGAWVSLSLPDILSARPVRSYKSDTALGLGAFLTDFTCTQWRVSVRVDCCRGGQFRKPRMYILLCTFFHFLTEWKQNSLC